MEKVSTNLGTAAKLESSDGRELQKRRDDIHRLPTTELHVDPSAR